MQNDLINYESLKQLITDKVDKRHEELKSDRLDWDKKAAERIIAATFGTAPSPNKNAIVELYTNLGDMTFPSLLRKMHARQTAWMDMDFIRWKPDGVESTDTTSAYWLTDYHRDNLNNELSNFHSVIRATVWQRNLCNISPFSYYWVTMPKIEYDYQMDDSSGEFVASNFMERQIPYEYDLQGLKFEFVSIFTCHPDVLEASSFEDTNDLDLYTFKFLNWHDVETDPIWSGAKPYTFEPNVLYRGVQGLVNLDKQIGVSFSPAQRMLNNSFKSDNTEQKGQKQLLEVKTVLLKQIKIDGKIINGNGRGLRLIYAKAGSTCEPLFLEYLPFRFQQKTLRLGRKWIDPYNLYNDSELGLAYNQHAYIVTNRQLQASAMAMAAMPPKLLPTLLLDAFQGTAEELKKFMLHPGEARFYKTDETTQALEGQILSLGTKEEAIQNLTLFQQAIDQCRADIQQINSQVTQESGATGTAAYNKQVAQEMDMLSTEDKAAICRDYLRPALQYSRELGKFAFRDMKLTSSIGEEDEKELTQDYEMEQLEELSQQMGGSIPLYKNVNGDKPSLVQVNPLTKKKQAIISKALFQNSQCSLDLEFETQEYQKEATLAESVQLFGQVLANIPQEATGFKLQVSKIAIDRLLQLTKDPNYEEIVKKLEQEVMAALNPPPPPPEQMMAEQENAQAQTQAVQAKAAKDSAQAEHMAANAEKTRQEVADNETAKQLIGVN